MLPKIVMKSKIARNSWTRCPTGLNQSKSQILSLENISPRDLDKIILAPANASDPICC